MTKEELEEEAYQYDKEHLRDNGTRWYHNVTIREAYLAGAKPREKRIAELEAQIEKMKCCEICRHHKWGSCNYHSLWVNDCKENGMKLFELKEIKEK